MPNLGGFEWIILLVIIVLIFGVGRVGKIGGELGSAIRQFREGLSGGKKGDTKDAPAEAAHKDD
jgi:sec-independent protein translocase protein TatA